MSRTLGKEYGMAIRNNIDDAWELWEQHKENVAKKMD
jgi:hypothetical protein